MVKKKADNESISTFEETLMWTSYRYCIGRHTYVVTMANDIAKHYYDKLSHDRRQFTAIDIRRSIADCIKYTPVEIAIDYSIPEDERLSLEYFFEFLQKYNVKTIDELLKYDRVKVYREHYGDTDYKFKVSICETHDNKPYFSTMDIDDLIPWMNLASFFDVDHYKTIKVKLPSYAEPKEVKVFESWERDLVPIDGQPGYYHVKDFGWHKVYIDVESYKVNPGYCGYISEEFIVKD